MARGIPMFFHGAIPKGTGMRDVWMQRIIDMVTAYQSNGEQAWEEADVISSTLSSYDVVYHSVGDQSLGGGSGDADIWMRLKRVSTNRVSISFFLDYSPTSHTGKFERPTLHSTYFMCDVTTETYPIEYWAVVNEYEIVIVHRILTGTPYLDLCLAGQIQRPYTEQVNGIARLTSQSGTGDDVVIGLDRDITSNILVGQKVWLVNQTPDGTSLQTTNPDPDCTVKAITANSITLDGVASTFAVGSLVGLDPSPMYMTARAGRDPYGSAVQCVVDLWGGQAAYQGTSNQLIYYMEETDSDPDANGLYPISQAWVRDGPSTRRGFRGTWGLAVAISKTGPLVAAKDVVEVDWDPNQLYKYFEGTYFLTIAGSWTLCLGPGALEY